MAGCAIGTKVAVHYAAFLTLREVTLIAEKCLTEAEDTKVVVRVQLVNRLSWFGCLINGPKILQRFHLEISMIFLVFLITINKN